MDGTRFSGDAALDRALVVEDARDQQVLISAVLARLGLHVAAAATGREALARMAELDPDVVVLDLCLPDVDGVEVLRGIREVSDAYVLVLTGRTGEPDLLEALGAGADDYLTKPIGPAQLGARVQALRSRPRRRVVDLRADRVTDGAPPPLLASVREALEPTLPAEVSVLARCQLEVHHQPQVDLRSGALVGWEALARLRVGDDLVGPDRFVSLAEDAGLMGDLTRGVLWASRRFATGCRALGHAAATAINVSTSDLVDPSFPAAVAEVIAADDGDPSEVTLELTEDRAMEFPDRCAAALHELRSLGVRISIDDFGTGRSSLAYLRDLPADEVKLDRTFVDHLADRPRSIAVVRATVQLAHDLGLLVVGEGVERPDDLALLVELGVDLAQGYLLGRPLDREGAELWASAGTGGAPWLDETLRFA